MTKMTKEASTNLRDKMSAPKNWALLGLISVCLVILGISAWAGILMKANKPPMKAWEPSWVSYSYEVSQIFDGWSAFCAWVLAGFLWSLFGGPVPGTPPPPTVSGPAGRNGLNGRNGRRGRRGLRGRRGPSGPPRTPSPHAFWFPLPPSPPPPPPPPAGLALNLHRIPSRIPVPINRRPPFRE